MEQLKKFQIRPEVLEYYDEMVDIRRDLHTHPELGLQEHRTAEVVAKHLRSYGIEQITEKIANTGIVALIEGKQPGRTVLVRADMDGLPIEEDSGAPYSSKTPAMHACGHDGHMAMALTVARLLQKRRNDFNGTVKMVFQPAEEGPGGAKPMIDAGVLRAPDVDVALGIHLWNEFPVGHIGVQDGPMMAAADTFKLTITGVGGHGAKPHTAIDPIVVAAHVITALQTIPSRRVDPFKSVVVTIGSIHGGTKDNIIPERVEMLGTVRSMEPSLREHLPAYLEQIIGGVTSAFGAKHDLRYTYGYPVTANNPDACQMVRDIARPVVESEGAGKVRGVQTMGGEDMSFFLNEVPGCFFFVGSANPEQGLHHPHHSPHFNFDEHALPLGVEVMLRAVDAALKSSLSPRRN
jgi:amidohydrolase